MNIHAMNQLHSIPFLAEKRSKYAENMSTFWTWIQKKFFLPRQTFLKFFHRNHFDQFRQWISSKASTINLKNRELLCQSIIAIRLRFSFIMSRFVFLSTFCFAFVNSRLMSIHNLQSNLRVISEQNATKFSLLHKDVELQQLHSNCTERERSEMYETTYTLGKRRTGNCRWRCSLQSMNIVILSISIGDRLVASDSGYKSYDSPTSVRFQFRYPAEAFGSYVSYVEAIIETSTDWMRAYVKLGGINQRKILVYIDVWRTEYFRFKYCIYGYDRKSKSIYWFRNKNKMDTLCLQEISRIFTMPITIEYIG